VRQRDVVRVPRGAVQPDEAGGSESGGRGRYPDPSQQRRLPATSVASVRPIPRGSEPNPHSSIRRPGDSRLPGAASGPGTNATVLRTDRDRARDPRGTRRGELDGASVITAISRLPPAGGSELSEDAERSR